jgi:hypothetical protein
MVMSQPGGLSPALASRMERISLILRGGEDEDRRGEEGWRGEEKERTGRELRRSGGGRESGMETGDSSK